MAAMLTALEQTSAKSPPLPNLPRELTALPPARAAALGKLCLAIFNLHEFLYVD